MWLRTGVAGMLCAALAAGCGKSNTIVVTAEEWETQRLRQTLAGEDRLNSVGLPLLAAAAPQCGGRVMPATGARFLNAASVRLSNPEWAAAVLGAEERLQAVSVVPSMAGAAGLRKGDILVRMGGEEAPRGESAVAAWSAWSNSRLASRQPMDISVLRGGEEVALRLSPTIVCGYGLGLWPGNDLYARTSNGQINVTSGLLDFARNDRELALVIAHEIAHNNLKHRRDMPVGAADGPVTIAAFNMVSDIIGANARGALAVSSGEETGARLAPIEQELEADYVGLYIMASAGMEIDGAEQFWRRIQGVVPEGPTAGDEATHPSHAARFAALRDWVAEIKAKQAKGVPLVPERHDWHRLLVSYGGAATTSPAPSAPLGP